MCGGQLLNSPVCVVWAGDMHGEGNRDFSHLPFSKTDILKSFLII